MKLTREDFLNAIKTRVGEDNSDDAITFIENMTDTFDEMEKQINGDGVDWKKKYEDNDKEWRDKYTQRFYQGTEDNTPPTPTPIETNEPKTFNDLFKIGE